MMEGRQAPEDLKIAVHDTFMVYPAEETERRSMFLSNIDKVLNFDVQTVHFFRSSQDFPFQRVVEKLKTGLARAFVPYDFMAGRLKFNSDKGRLEIDCNAAGAGFVVASSECTLEELGDLVYPNPAFDQLSVKTLSDSNADDHPLCVFQLTSFKCGGFAMGMCTSHTTFDGLSFKTFLDNLAALASDKPLPVNPFTDRHLLAARSPPRISFPHPELLKLDVPPTQPIAPPVFEANPKGLHVKLLRLSPHDIAALKEKASADGQASANLRITGFNVVTAHVWRCRALASAAARGDSYDENASNTILYAVDIRSRVNPPLPKSYAGNAVLSAYAKASYKELQEVPFSKLVEKVAEGASRMTDEYAKSAINWGELYAGFPLGDFLVSSWWRLGFAKVEYPWGKPIYSCPVVYHRHDVVLLLPDIDEDNGVNVLVALPTAEMEKFQSLFRQYLA